MHFTISQLSNKSYQSNPTLKFQEEQALQSLKINRNEEESYSQHSPFHLSDSSNIHFGTTTTFDKMSEYSQSQTIKSQNSTGFKRKPSLQQLCRTIQTLRYRMPRRSLEQIVIRLYQANKLKKQIDQELKLSYNMVGEERSYFSNNQQIQAQNVNLGVNIGVEQREKSRITSQKMREDYSNQQHPQLQQQSDKASVTSKSRNINKIFNRYCLKQGANYIYKPKGKEVIVQFLKKNTKKTKFVNFQQQKRYRNQRTVAKSFVDKGYGVNYYRKELQQRNISVIMNKNDYRTHANSVIILAFRKLQSFLEIQCKKTIKHLDKAQMESIDTTLLNCRILFEPELVVTFMKLIKAGYGLDDVVIGQIESVKFYLACQKFLYGKNVTMQFMERLGCIQHRKRVQNTMEYLEIRKQRIKERNERIKMHKKLKRTKQSPSNSDNHSLKNIKDESCNISNSTIELKHKINPLQSKMNNGSIEHEQQKELQDFDMFPEIKQQPPELLFNNNESESVENEQTNLDDQELRSQDREFIYYQQNMANRVGQQLNGTQIKFEVQIQNSQ